MMDDNDVFQPPDTEEDYKKYLEDKFYRCIQVIDNKRPYAIDNEFPSISEEYCDDISGYVNFSLETSDLVSGRYVDLDSAKSALDVIIKFLDNGWVLNSDMRNYLSSRFKLAINGGGEGLQSLFHLRKSDGDKEKRIQRINIGGYVVFRMRFNERFKRAFPSRQVSLKVFYGMISDELSGIYNVNAYSEDKIKRNAEYALRYLPRYNYSRDCDFLYAHSEYLKKYFYYTKKELNENKLLTGESRELRVESIKWIRDKSKSGKIR